MKIYIAAPIVGATDVMKAKIERVKECISYIKSNDISIYDPKEHGVPNAWGMSMNEWARCIFALDVVAIDDSDWVVVCDFGRHGTAGTAWECGYAFAKGKKILIVQMDETDQDYSVMMHGCSTNYCTFEEFLISDVIKDLFIEAGKKKYRTQFN